MLRLQSSWNTFLILTRISYWLFVFQYVSIVQASQRYPYVLPKCCEPNGNSRNAISKDFKGGPTGQCGNEGSDDVLLPTVFFPAMSTDLEFVAVKLRKLVDGITCDEELDKDITLVSSDFEEENTSDDLEPLEDLAPLTSVTVGKNKGFNEYSFAGDSLLISKGSTHSQYGPSQFCISSRTVNKTKLVIKRCKQKNSVRRVGIPRCCGGHQSILTSPPTSSNESFLRFCSTPTLEKDLWSPWSSEVLGRVSNSTHFYQTKYIPKNTELDERNSFPESNCRLLRFTKNWLDDENGLSLLEDGRLEFQVKNVTEVVEDFCIDGINGGDGRKDADGLGNTCEASEKEEVVVAYVCSPATINVSFYNVLDLPACGCFSRHLDVLFHLRVDSFRKKNKNRPARKKVTGKTIPVRLTKEENGGSLKCPRGFEDSTLEFKDTIIPFRRDGSLIHNGSTFDMTQFCIRSVFHNAITLRKCKEDCSVEQPCINRCCSGNTHLDLEAFTCEAPSSPTTNGTGWSHLRFYASLDDISPSLGGDLDVQPLIRTKGPFGLCYFSEVRSLQFAGALEESFKLMRGGDLMEKWGKDTWGKDTGRNYPNKPWEKVNPDSYCIEPILIRKKTGELDFTGIPPEFVVLRCWKDEKEFAEYLASLTSEDYLPLAHFLGVLFAQIPSFLYVGIAVVYILRKDKEPVFRWSIVGYSISIFATVCIDIASDVNTTFLHYQSAQFSIQRFQNFAYLCACCWISVLCFDLWLNITFLTPGSKSLKRMRGYVAFAFTVPIVYLGTGLILNAIYSEQLQNGVATPEYTVFNDIWGGFTGVLLCIHFILFVATAVKLWIAQKTTEIKTQRKTFMMYLKLFLLMGTRLLLLIIVTLYSLLDGSILGVQLLGLLMSVAIILIQPVFLFVFLALNVDTKRYMEANHPRVKRVMDFIHKIGYPVRKCWWLCCCRCIRRTQTGTSGSAKNEIPMNSGHMYVHTPHRVN